MRINSVIKRNKGITLIALVITVIILLILAGISISTLFGDNGILTKAKEAKIKTEISEEKEGLSLATTDAQLNSDGYDQITQESLQSAINKQFGDEKATVIDNGDGTFAVSFVDSKRNYNISSNGVENGINWNTIFETAVAPTEQTAQGVIGIGTDGNVVNMDLWEYTQLADGTYCINDSEVLNNSENGGTNAERIRNPGYLGEIIDGKIIGTIPQYIKVSNTEYKPVTSLYNTFYALTNLKYAPKIPSTVTNMWTTFHSCTNLIEASPIPGKVENMQVAFCNCSNLEVAPNIPDSVTNLAMTFEGCIKLKKAPKLGRNINNMGSTFNNCSNLIEISNIPNNLLHLNGTFSNCISLIQIPKLPDNLLYLNGTFSNCTSLIQIPKLPDNLLSLEAAFYKCTSLKEAPEIPNTVENMRSTFNGCTNLEKGPNKIPNSVNNMLGTFQSCNNLSGTLEINANLSGKVIEGIYLDYSLCFSNSSTNENSNLKITGTSPMVNELLNTKSSNSHISLL